MDVSSDGGGGGGGYYARQVKPLKDLSPVPARMMKGSDVRLALRKMLSLVQE